MITMDPLNLNNMGCNGCAMRSIPINTAKHFGHTKCSFHRECTGNIYWEPENCNHCIETERSWESMDANTRFAAMGMYAGMLQTTKVKINRAFPNRNWDHIPIMDFKF